LLLNDLISLKALRFGIFHSEFSSHHFWRTAMVLFNFQAGRVLAACVVGALLLTVPAVAQPCSGPHGWGPGMMMGPGMMGAAMCNPRAAGFAEWRIDRIERAVQPTEAQRGALNDLKTASAKAAETIAAACPKEFPQTAGARLELMEKRLEAMLAAVKIVRPAFDAFSASLSAEQKAALDRIEPRQRGWRWSRQSEH
jgi:LTXXQ motif family protein